MIGLGKMGMNMARRLLSGGHLITAYNRTPERINEIEKEGARGAFTIEDMITSLPAPRIVWLMVPAGKPVDEVIGKLQPLPAMLKIKEKDAGWYRRR